MTWVGLIQLAKGLNSKAEVSLQKTSHLRAWRPSCPVDSNLLNQPREVPANPLQSINQSLHTHPHTHTRTQLCPPKFIC